MHSERNRKTRNERARSHQRLDQEAGDDRARQQPPISTRRSSQCRSASHPEMRDGQPPSRRIAPSCTSQELVHRVAERLGAVAERERGREIIEHEAGDRAEACRPTAGRAGDRESSVPRTALRGGGAARQRLAATCRVSVEASAGSRDRPTPAPPTAGNGMRQPHAAELGSAVIATVPAAG